MPVTQAHEAIALVSFLVETAERRGSGWLEVREGDAPVGTVVFRAGHVAWASSAGQKEHLGHFLERIGYLSPEQLQESRSLLRAAGPERKLGRLLEDAGLISRPVLRICLLFHLRAAVSSLLLSESLAGDWEEGLFCAEDELTFPVVDLLPEWLLARAPDTGLPPEDLASTLLPLAEIPGYRGAFAADWMGRLVACHGFGGGEKGGASQVAAAALAILGGPCALGRTRQGFLEADEGVVIARWLDRDRRLLIALRLGAEGRPGTALHRLGLFSPEILRSLDPQNEGALIT